MNKLTPNPVKVTMELKKEVSTK